MAANGFTTGLKRLLARCLPASAPERPMTLEEALPWLVPKVRPRFLHEALSLHNGRSGPEFQPLAGIFAVSLVLDMRNQERDVDAAMLKAWNVDFDRLMQRARSNLLARGGEEGFESMGPGRYRSTWGDNLDGSRMLLPGILRRLQVVGDPVVVLPKRDAMLVVGSEDPPSLRWALEAGLAYLNEDPRSLNACPLRLRNFQWELFQARHEHPVCPLLDRAERHRLMEEYARQKFLLDRRHDATGQAITVAPFQLEQTSAGATQSFTVWSPAMGEAWLPVADRVQLAWELGGERGRARVPWAKAQATLSQLLEPVGLFPERYRFKQAPPAGLLESLLS